MATLTVGINKQYATLTTALDAAHDGDTVAVNAGVYLNDYATVRTKVTLVAVGGKVTLLSNQTIASGKALLTVTTDAVIDGFVFAGAKAADGTAAGLLDTGGALVVRNSLFTADQNGLVVRPATMAGTGTVLIQGSEFAGNGANDGFSGNVNVGAVASLTIQDSYIHDAAGGDEVKTLAKTTTINGTRIIDSTASVNAGAAVAGTPSSTPTADVDAPKGGVVTIQTSVIEKGPNTAGPAIRLGGDTAYANTALVVTGSTLVSDKAGATLVQNTTGTTAVVSSDVISGFATIATGPAVQVADTTPAVRPAISTTPLVLPGTALPVEYGRAGAVVANGTILTVGAGGQYATLSLALAASHDGDTIRVAAGTYTDTGITISHKVIIEGVGGLARFVAGALAANGLAEITTTTDVTLRNIEVTGASVVGGVAAGIRVQGGNLTLVNSDIHDNGAGVVADKGVAGSVGIYDSELARNGTADGLGLNLNVAEVGTLTLRNDWVHDAVGGGEIRSRADNTVIDGTRVLQSVGSGAYAIDLPNGGRASIANSAIEKGAGSLGGALVHVGGDAAYAGSSVTLSADTLISDVTAATTTFVAAPAPGIAVISGTGFQGGTTGSVQAVNAGNTAAVVKSGLSVSTAAPWGALAAPAAGALTMVAPVQPTPGRGVMILRLSEDAYRGNAQFTLSVDGVQVGGTLTATAAHGLRQSQSFTIAGNFAPGPHVVGVTLVNDLSSGAAGEDRNLYVDGLGFNGEDLHATAALTSNGTALLATGTVTRATPITVNLSEDAWKGDAQAFITIDGKLQGGISTVTAAHGAGQTQAMSFMADLTPGGHTVGVTYLNDAKGGPGEDRNLYIDSMDIAGAHYAGAAASLTTNGASTFAFTVAPPPAANAGLFLTAGLAQPLVNLVPLG